MKNIQKTNKIRYCLGGKFKGPEKNTGPGFDSRQLPALFTFLYLRLITSNFMVGIDITKYDIEIKL